MIETKVSTEDTENVRATSERIKQALVALFCVLLSAFVAVPFFFMGRPANAPSPRIVTTHDMFVHYEQMRSFYNGLAAGRIYPRWEAETNLGFGAPTTSYYPPGVYYVTSVFFALARDWAWALLWAHLFMIAAAAAAMYVYIKQTMSRTAALTAMVAYAIMPYHVVDQYQRGALAELLCFVWMPLVLLFIDRLMSRYTRREKFWADRWTALAGLALVYGAFLWSHPPTAYQFSMGLGLYILLKAFWEKEWRGLIMVGVGIALGLALSAAYLMPAFIQQNLIHPEFVSQAWPYHKSYVFSQSQINGAAYNRFFDALDVMWTHSASWIVIIGIILIAFTVWAGGKKSSFIKQVALYLVLGCFAAFMMTGQSEPIGRLIPKIDIGVFAWRMLSITALVAALLLGACVQVISGALKHKQLLAAAALSLVAVLAIGDSFRLTYNLVVKPVQNESVFKPMTRYFNPVTVPAVLPVDLAQLPDSPPAVLAYGQGEVNVERWDPENRLVEASLETDDILMIRTFNYPGWSATVDGRPAQIITGPELGDIQLELEPGRHIVALNYDGTPVMKWAELITILTFCLLVGLAVAPALRSRLARPKE